jgi:thiol-disulfide isomerase/thioredoxin
MIKKRNATLAVCAVLLFCVIAAGCTGPTASQTQSAANESTKATSAQVATSTQAVAASVSVTVSPSAKPTPSVTLAPTATPTPSNIPANIPATGVVTLYFYYRPDCPYCQALEPQITALQTQYGGKVSVQWIQSTGVVPTLVLFNKSGVQVGSWVDPGTTAPIITKINSLLASG